MDRPRLTGIYNTLLKDLADPKDQYLLASVEEQMLFLCEGDRVIRTYPASTSRLGVGTREDSLKTPPGLHRICEKIGSGAPLGRIFRDRRDTGADWDGVSREDNLILTRILRLEGLEEGINRGPGVDSRERYIYIHGTNREDLVGTPFTHGCLTLRNTDMADLFERVPEGTLLYIDPPALVVAEKPCRNIHFTGIFGTGMSALAQYLRFEGIGVSGSDRLLESEDTAPMRRSLEGLGCAIASQDGTGVTGETDALCVSTAIEETNPDIAAARTRGIPVVHRSDLLASIIASRRTVAVAGTSGKSTVTAMIFEFLSACGKSPSLISGAPLTRLEEQGLIGNAYSGGSDLLVVEADESDGTLVKYSPAIAVVLNISKDHKDIDEIQGLFATLISRSSWTATNADDPLLVTLPATLRFGRDGAARGIPTGGAPGDIRQAHPRGHRLPASPSGRPQPREPPRGAVCLEHLGCDAETLAAAVRGFRGVARRFSITQTRRGITVVDDFAHNPAKISAAVTAARGLAGRIIAVYQPHGFGPTRFLRNEYIAAFRSLFRDSDSLYLLPIYYAGGTAQRDISSQDIIDGLGPVAFHAEAVQDRKQLLERLSADAKQGD
jgi:UDP-N-acetylmuramate--alanine ligase